jgi:hypothetical protein
MSISSTFNAILGRRMTVAPRAWERLRTAQTHLGGGGGGSSTHASSRHASASSSNHGRRSTACGASAEQTDDAAASEAEAELFAAYAATTYEVATEVGLQRLRVGHKSAGMDTLLLSHPTWGSSWGFITAWNPASVPLDEQLNEERNRALAAALEGRSSKVYPALGRGDDGWDEPGFLVVGLSRDDMVALGEQWGQNAVLFCAVDTPVELVDSRPSPKAAAAAATPSPVGIAAGSSASEDSEAAERRAIIIGAGAAGVTAAASLARAGIRCVIVDASGFDVGRLSRFASAGVPANTKLVNLVAQFKGATEVIHSEETQAALEILRGSGQPMPLLEPHDPAGPLGWCSIEGMIGPLRAVTKELEQSPFVTFLPGTVESLRLDTSTMVWTALGRSSAGEGEGEGEGGGEPFEVAGRVLVLSTGAEPRSLELPVLPGGVSVPRVIDMETALDKRDLAALLRGTAPPASAAATGSGLVEGGGKVVVGVVGNSHSGALILENLRQLCEEQAATTAAEASSAAAIEEVRLMTRNGDGCRLALWDGQEYR